MFLGLGRLTLQNTLPEAPERVSREAASSLGGTVCIVLCHRHEDPSSILDTHVKAGCGHIREAKGPLVVSPAKLCSVTDPV